MQPSLHQPEVSPVGASPSCQRRGRRGVSLAEVMAAAVVAAILAALLSRPFGDGRASMNASRQREQAYAMAERMVESYRAMGYSGMSTITDQITTLPPVTIGPITYTRTVEFIGIAGIPLAAYESPGDGWFCADTVTDAGYTTRFRAIRCTVAWDSGNKSVSLIGVVAP